MQKYIYLQDLAKLSKILLFLFAKFCEKCWWNKNLWNFSEMSPVLWCFVHVCFVHVTNLKLVWRSRHADAPRCTHFPTDICSVIQEGEISATRCHLDETSMDITTVHHFATMKCLSFIHLNIIFFMYVHVIFWCRRQGLKAKKRVTKLVFVVIIVFIGEIFCYFVEMWSSLIFSGFLLGLPYLLAPA